MGKTIRNYRDDGMRKIKPITKDKPRKKINIGSYSEEDDEDFDQDLYDDEVNYSDNE